MALWSRKRKRDGQVRVRSGGDLPISIADYDRHRPELSISPEAACYAPFLSMDFDALGSVRLCNHSHTTLAEVSEDLSLLDLWRGPLYRRYRAEMRDYVLDDENCQHCIRQCRAGSSEHVFATEQFDRWAHDDPDPPYPKRLIFRLANTCNLACIMCDGYTSSRIRHQRDRLPPIPHMYGERFFRDMREILPHVEHVEFYGGEPFLVKEHLRIFDIITEIGASCSIYVNTNAVSLHPRAKRYLEALNFRTIAVSMDAVRADVHAAVRTGLREEVFRESLDYFLDLRERRGINVMLNVTEHRKNWFELPDIFSFAEEHRLYLHINTCIHPHNVTLYTLPSDELGYVLDYLTEQRSRLLDRHGEMTNLARYDFLLSLIRTELSSRRPGWQPIQTIVNEASDGLLASPVPGRAPFDTPEAVAAEGRRMARHLAGVPMLDQLLRSVRALRATAAWAAVADELEGLLASMRKESAPSGGRA